MARSSRPRWPWARIGLGALLLSFLLATQWVRLSFPLTDNEGDITCLAQQWAFGSPSDPSIGTVSFLILYLPAILLGKAFPYGEVSLHLLVLAFHFADALLLAALVRRLGGGGVGAWGAAFAYALLILPPLFLPWAAEGDLLMQPWLLACFWAATFERRGAWALSGVLWALACLSKPGALFFIPVWVMLLGIGSYSRWAWAAAGAAATYGLGLLPLLLRQGGGLKAQARIFFGGSYTHSGWDFLAHNAWYRDFLARWGFWALAVYGIPLGILLWNWVKSRGKKPLAGARVGMAWALCALISVSASGYFFSYYFMCFIPPLALGLGVWIEKSAERRTPARLALGALLLLATAAFLADAGSIRQRMFAASQYDPVRYCGAKRMGQDIRARAKPQDRLLAWTFDPQIYAYSGLLMAVVDQPFINQVPSVPGAEDRARAGFAAAPPRFCVVSRSPLVYKAPDWLEAGLKKGYDKVETVDSLELYVRR